MERNDKSIAKGKCKTMKLGQLASFINGYPFKPSEWKEKGIPIIRIQNLNNDQAPYNYYDEGLPSKYIIESGDILISWSGSLGVFEWTKSKAYLNQHIFKVIFDKEEINKRFFQYAVESSLTEMSKHLHGATMKHIVKRDFINLPIPVPPLPVQARIVDELDCLQGILSKKRQQLAEYHSLAQAIFHQMFGDPVVNEKGWEVKRLGEVCTNKGIYGAASPSAPKEENRPRYIRITDIDDFGNLNDDYVVSANKEDDQTYQLETGDILFARTGATVGKTYLYKGTTPQIYAGYLIKFSINLHIIDPTFLFYITKSYSYKKWVSMQYNGVAQPNINARKYSALPIILPPLPLQQSFAARIAAIDSQRERLAASIRELETLLACRMETLLNCPQA